MKKDKAFFKRLSAFGLSVVMAASLLQAPVHAESISFFEDSSTESDTVDETGNSPKMEKQRKSSVGVIDFKSENSDSLDKSGVTATFLPGTSFNKEIKKIAGNDSATITSKDTNIQGIERAELSEAPETKATVSVSDSEVPIYAWFKEGTLYIASEAEKLSVNASAFGMFHHLNALEAAPVTTDFDTSTTENFGQMFQDCPNLTYIDISSFSTESAESMDKMFHGNEALDTISLGKSWQFVNSVSLPKSNWKSDKDSRVWSCAALETMYTANDAATFSATNDNASVIPEEELFWGESLKKDNIYPVSDPSSAFTAFCICADDEVPFGYYRRVEVPSDEVIGENWFHNTNYGSEPLGSTMWETLVALAYEGEQSLEEGTRDFTSMQNDIWHFVSKYSEKWDGSSWNDKSYDDISKDQKFKLYLYESLDGHQNLLGIDSVEIEIPEIPDKTYEITVSKKDRKGNLIAGAEMEILKEGKTVYCTWTTEEGKTCLVKGLKPGAYTLVEKNPPQGYEKADDIIFTITENGKVFVENKEISDRNIIMIDDYIYGDVIIKKQDVNGNILPGAEMIMTNKDNKIVDSWTSGTTPHITKKLPVGEYTISESKAPNGYVVAPSIKFKLDEDGVIWVGKQKVDEIIVTDEYKTVNVQVSKRNIAGEEIPGAKLEVRDANGKLIEKWTSVANKTHILKDIIPGKYILTEVLPPEGYLKAADIEFVVEIGGKVTVNGKETDKVIMTDKYAEYDVVISKQDINGKEIGGAKLEVTDSEHKVIDSWTSVEGRFHIIDNLKAGTYTLTERVAPAGYKKAESIKFVMDVDGKVTVGGKETSHIIMIDEYDDPYVTFSKQDISGKEIEGAELEIWDKEGKVVESWVSTKDQSHVITGLEPGDYTMVEITAPDGYKKAESIKFTVTDDYKVFVNSVEVDKIVMIDDFEKGNVLIRKVTIEKGTEVFLADTKLTIQNKDGKAIASWTTGETGKLVPLDSGEYKLVETEAPEGYDIAEPIEFIVNRDNTVTLKGEKEPLKEAVITMVDKLSDGRKNVRIEKVGMDNKPLEGAVLNVIHRDKRRDEIDIQWTTKNKEETVQLLPGKYTLHESTAPDGYLKAEDIDFIVKADGTVTVNSKVVSKITMKDKPTEVAVAKEDAETGERLAGAVLQVKDKKGNVIEEWTSSEDYHYVTGRLAAGKEYVLHEKSAPNGYKTAKDINFKVNSDDSVLYITMEDEAEEIVPMEYGSLQIFKIVDGEGGSTTKKFGFILSIMNKDNTPFTGKLPYTMASGDKGVLQFDKNGRAGFELSHGQYIFFDKLPAGTFYSVKELDYSKEGYTTTVKDGTAETKKGDNVVTFINTFGKGSGITTNGAVTNGHSASGTIIARDTGDSSSLLLWTSLIFVLGAAVTGFLFFRKKIGK